MSFPNLAQFTPVSSSIPPNFWHKLTELKLNVLKLSDEPITVNAGYQAPKWTIDRLNPAQNSEIAISRGIEFEPSSFPGEILTNESGLLLRCVLRNFNTIEEFKNFDKAAALSSLGQKLWEDIQSGKKQSGTSLNPLFLITFADLKKYKYYYWFCWPALLLKPGWTAGQWSNLRDHFTSQQIESLALKMQSSGFLLTKLSANNDLEYAEISEFSSFFDGVEQKTLVFIDSSSHPTAFGWNLRNVLTYLNTAFSCSSIRVVCWREDTSESQELNIDASGRRSCVVNVEKLASQEGTPATVGWEKNDAGKLGPRLADLGPLMDPARLADQAVDLNLQLMRWRIMPSLDLEKVSKTRVLLLGSGTLGCYVSRTLLAWGVRKITFVDSSTVSFSNPVRQPLFEFDDSLNGGKPKAEAAATALKRIYPGVDATGINLSIPMPGHPVPSSQREKVKQDIQKLEELIDQHDVVYLLMDSRESRWLPTVIGASKQKLVMNVALGFDTYLVMRHGVPSENFETGVPSSIVRGQAYTGRLGCYYCNDIVAPTDSLTDRTLDQMCTVTRPGIASIASSTAVELMVSILQHPKGINAPSEVPIGGSAAAGGANEIEGGSCLGIVPHQIRGFLSQFSNLKITGQSYDKCTGCSHTIINAYKTQGSDILFKVFEDAKELERITGLDKLAEESEKMMQDMEWGGGGEGSEEDDF